MKHITLILVSILSFTLSSYAQADEEQDYKDAINDVAKTFAMSTIVSTYCSLSEDAMEVALAKDLELQAGIIINAFDRSRAISDKSRRNVAIQLEVWGARYIKEVLDDGEIQSTLCLLETFDTMNERLKLIGDVVFLKA